MEYSIDSPLPSIRTDISAVEYAPGHVAMYDDAGYSTEVVSLPIDVVRLLSRLDGTTTVMQLAQQAAHEGVTFDMDDVLSLVSTLDAEGLLDSPTFRARRNAVEAEYNSRKSRPTAFHGQSYPDDPDELAHMLDGILAAASVDDIPEEAPVAVVAPHIDFRVGGKTYGPAYRALQRSDAQTFIVLGTSHQMSYDAFMVSTMDFETPLGPLPVDRDLIEEFRSRLPFEITRNEIAHRREHSIEFQALFLRHLFRDRDVKIVPILAGSLFAYVEHGRGRACDDERLTILFETLRATAEHLGRSVCFVAGADMSHVGHKFGDVEAASQLLPLVREVDARILARAVEGDADAFLDEIALERNRFRICGTAPIYATLRLAEPERGLLLAYDTWDERERSSAVTFASMAFYGRRQRD